MRIILFISAILLSTTIFSQTYYIPTVVHVLYFDSEEDMLSSEVENLINHVNLGLRGMSENNIVSREIFDTLWADTEIQLCLATVDEFGLLTDGIVHKEIETPIEPGDFFRTKGESTPWNTDLYLNIWVSAMGSGSESNGGIATTPTVPHSNFPNPYIGVTLNKDSYNYSQILIHEIGHFLGLEHLYFDDIDDTPCSNNAINPEPKCIPEFLTLNTCSNEEPIWNGTDPPDMIENYMEYYGNCAKMFTRGQKIKMRDYANTYYSAMINSQPNTCEIVVSSYVLDEVNTNIKVYPNPTFGEITIEHKKSFSYKIMTIYGQILEIGNGSNTLTINLHSYEKGMLFLIIEGSNNSSIYKIFKN